ncbi:conserved hypothetical protein [Coccidioides posadasii str. Silveira]|uniref:Uncharacterized protein n=1 Tax=Coccidioides posadasii (strain RMSCC 757 / Silveira) TaxID=443226 RepID=E9D748_COCPS|nr:conserved hypothetical protein [Coccidioides posadasii str. Silveira]
MELLSNCYHDVLCSLEPKIRDKLQQHEKWHAGENKKTLYIYAINALVNSSFKYHAIQHILQSMRRDYHGCPEKIVILTEFLHIVHMLEIKQDYYITAVYSSMSVENQDTCINIFNQDLLLSGDETNTSPGILISTLKILDIDYICIHIF